jgi:ketosteroid isomerase-like protein
MSQENVEIVRSAFAAWNRGDLETALEAYAPETEFRLAGVFPGLETAYYGHDGVRNFWQQFRADWEEIFLDIEEIIDRGEHVIVLFRFRAKGRDGIEVQRPFAQCYTMRGGRAVRVENYAGWDQALKAAGLTEQDAHADS